MPLSQGVLKVNLGIPIIVLCNKIDIIHQTGEKAKILQENLDFIQMHLREYSLLYGASVMFTSAKARESKNLDTLYQYINHRLYDKIKFAKKAQIVEKDELFIPTGFDSLNLIKQLQSGSVMMTGPDGQPLTYEDVLRPQFTAMNNPNSKQFTGRGAQQQNEVFLESDDWQTLLQEKFRKQEKQESDSKKPGAPDAAGNAAKDALRKSTVGKPAAREKIKNAVGVAKAADGKPAAGEEGKKADSGQAYFVKLLRSKQFQDTKKKRSQAVAQEQAQNIVNKVQNEMDENNAGGEGTKKQAVEDENDSESSENEEESKASADAPTTGRTEQA